MKNYQKIALLFLVLFVFVLRLYFVFSTNHFSEDAYFHLRLAEHIKDRGIPPFTDDLSYGGRELVLSPLYYYVIAFFLWTFPTWVGIKLFPQICMALLPLIVFAIVHKITKRFDASFFSAGLLSFIPILFSETLFSLSPLTVTIPLSFYSLYLFLGIKEEKHLLYFILSIVALSLLHTSVLFLIVAFLGYLLISRVEGFRLEKNEMEIIFFSTFVYLWIQVILFQRAFLSHGFIGLFQQNIPDLVMSQIFQSTNLSQSILLLGFFPLVFGIYCIYKYLFNIKNKPIYFFIAFSLGVALFTWLRILNPYTGFMYVGVCLAILSGLAYVRLNQYIRKTQFARYNNVLIVLMLVIIIPSMFLASIYFGFQEKRETVSTDMFETMEWIKENTPEGSVVISGINEGHLVTGIAQRKNIADTYFLLIDDSNERIRSIERIFTTQFQTEAVRLFDTYDVDYILLSKTSQELYGVDGLEYENVDCIREIYNSTQTKVYYTRCRLSVI